MSGLANILSPEAQENVPMLSGGHPPYLRYADSWETLAASAKNDVVELALWRRGPAANLSAFSPPTSDFEILTGAQEEILPDLAGTYEAAGWPQALFTTLQNDAQSFMFAFDKRLGSSLYRLRLQAVSDDACRKFHQDRVFQRLIITYSGKATIWREAESSRAQSAQAMDCVLLRGKRAGRAPNILHKSPRFTQGHPPRLMMVIDVIEVGVASQNAS